MLVFGEDTNDTLAIRELIAALRPDLADRVKPLRQPQVLLKNARPEEIAPRAERIAAAVRAAGARIRNAKEELQKRVIPLNLSAPERKKFITYQESDAPSVAARVREKGWAEEPKARSSSYDRFRVSVASCEG